MSPSRAPASQLREDLARAAQKADLAERTLDADAVVAEIELQSGRTAKVISRVDVLLDRLAEFQATGHEVAAQQALALLAGLSQAESADIYSRATNHKVGTILKVMRDLAESSTPADLLPTAASYTIACEALCTEYDPTPRSRYTRVTSRSPGLLLARLEPMEAHAVDDRLVCAFRHGPAQSCARFPESRRSPATFEGAPAVLSTSDHERKFAADGFGSASEAVGVRSGPRAIAEPAVERACGERGTRRMRRRL
jgi:hypothetical protein